MHDVSMILNSTTKAQIRLPAQSEQHPFVRFLDSKISSHVKVSLIMLK